METSGHLEYQSRSYAFDWARCEWFGPPYGLTVAAGGRGCGVSLVNLRVTSTRELSRMVGRTWVMDLEEAEVNPGIFRGEGGVVMDGERPHVWKAWVRCKRYDEDQSILVVDFSLVVINEDHGGGPEEIEGIAYCNIEHECDAD
jgi:hypothetical protein